MDRIVRGNDFRLRMDVLMESKDEAGAAVLLPFDFTGAEVRACIRSAYVAYVCGHEIEGNRVTVSVDGARVQNGVYGVELVVMKEGNLRSFKKGQFAVVEADVEDTERTELVEETVDLKSVVMVDYGVMPAGQGGSMEMDTELSETSKNGVENRVITAELKRKVTAEPGKGLSERDFTNEYREKLVGMPGEVYAKEEVYTKKEVSELVGSGSGFLLSDREVCIGVFGLEGGAGVMERPVYQRLATLLELPVVAGERKEYVLSDDPLGCNLYFSVESLVACQGESIMGEMFLSMYELVRVYVGNDYKTRIVVECKESGQPGLRARLNTRYVKGYGEKIGIDIALSGEVDVDRVAVVMPVLKYGKGLLVSFTADDGSASAFCRTWAAINGRPVCRMFYHANQLEAGDVPEEIVEARLGRTLGYTDGCGNERRLAHGVAIWPHAQANGGVMMDSTSPVDPGAGNTYRFMSPYLQWVDVEMMLKYGCSVYYHNIGTEVFGSDKEVGNVIAGLKADCERTVARVGRGMKVLARPDGNNVFIDAAKESGQILMSVAEGAPARDVLPFADPVLFKTVGSRFFPVASGGKTEQEMVKERLAAEYAKGVLDRKWFHFCCHTSTMEWVNLLVWINDRYGKDGSDDLWMATADEYYEYDYMRRNTMVRKSVAGGVLHLDVYLPRGQYFYYPELTLLVGGVQSTGVSVSENVYGLSYGMKDGALMVNVSPDRGLLDRAEEFTARYEMAKDVAWRSDAICAAGRLKEPLRGEFLARIERVEGGLVEVRGIAIDGITEGLRAGDEVRLEIVYDPADTTQRGVRWSSSNPEVATVDGSGLVRVLASGQTTVGAVSVHNDGVTAAREVTVEAVGPVVNQCAIVAEYDWLSTKKDWVYDDRAKLYISLANINHNIADVTAVKTLYDAVSGESLAGWTRMGKSELAAYYGRSFDSWMSSKNANGDLSSLFSYVLPYENVFKYNSVVYAAVGWHVPNGVYKVSLLSCTTEQDNAVNGRMMINRIEKKLPMMSLTQNLEWMKSDDIVVDEGVLALMVWADTGKRYGVNAFKIERIS